MMGSAGRLARVVLGTATILSATGGPLLAQQGDAWQALEPLPTPRRLLAAAAEGGKVYTFGGCGSPCFGPPAHTSTVEETRVEAFDPEIGRWEDGRGPIPAIFFGGAAAAPGNGRIYLVGGFLTGDRAYEYDPAADTWRSRAPMPTARHGLAAVALGGEIYAVGGSDGRAASGALEIYDPATDAWRRGPPLPTARVYLAAAALDGKLYAVGGSPDCCGRSHTAAVEVYDPAAGRWSTAAPLPVALQTSAAATDGRRLYVFGGLVPGEGVRSHTFEYDPATDAWRTRAPLAAGRDQAPAAVVGDRAFVPGGSVDCHCQALARLDRYTFPRSLPPPPPPPALRIDLSISKTAGTATLDGGERITYLLTVTNDGPDPAVDALVADSFPPELMDVTWTCTATGGALCARATGEGDLLERVSIPAGGGAAVTFEAAGTVPAAACTTPLTVTNVGTVEPPAGVVDTDASDDLDEVVVAVCTVLNIPSLSPFALLLLATLLASLGALLLRNA